MINIIEHAKDINKQLIIKSKTEACYILIVDGEIETSKEIIVEAGATLHVYYLFLNNTANLNISHTINQDAKIFSRSLVLSESEIKVVTEYDFFGFASVG